ncbi:pantoate--beta-alanine ligase [Pedobacter sp. SD-b]|uniref:Pantothenate synthetase n=1 Tax=Pedobacter segetis TaxID=2793069 RepID=A0ABS1BIM8_9SPHI|nr:pantoate--beta-alanine ligase [Pedobacter segetis]MBK0382211.1 pantoate--beta-alanine ligase [Pedobacter segetis]
MKVFKTQIQLANYLSTLKKVSNKMGLVPTMGALHQGHLSLIKKSKQLCDLTIASIFVNPTQFNNLADLLKYPKPIEQDIAMLEEAGCDVLFNPEVAEIYENPDEVWDYEVGGLNAILEGEFRPGHYIGVTQIVYKLFNLVKPDVAFFGQKDYQQYLVIKEMAKDFNLDVEIIACPIVREKDGLAMSSRNIRLNADERNKALTINRSLAFLKENYHVLPLPQLVNHALGFYKEIPNVKLEYLKICKKNSLKEITEEEDKKDAIALVACYVGETRLIDNMMLS